MPAAVRASRDKHREAFWTVVVGAPTALSILRLWVESGGELQTTLLLVSNVAPLNLVAALFATVTAIATMVLIAIFSAGGILRAAVAAAPEGSLLQTHPPLIVRAANVAPPWFVGAIFVLALCTWKIYALPLLVPAAVAVTQRPPWRVHHFLPAGVAIAVTLLAGYVWLITPAVIEAWGSREWLIMALLICPPFVAFGLTGSLPTWFAHIFAGVSQAAILVLTLVAVQSAVQTPILPLVVVEVTSGDSTELRLARGHVISVDDAFVTFLHARGGVENFPTGSVKTEVACANRTELPAFVTRVRDFHVEDSLLTAIGRHIRPRPQIDRRCSIDIPEPIRP